MHSHTPSPGKNSLETGGGWEGVQGGWLAWGLGLGLVGWVGGSVFGLLSEEGFGGGCDGVVEAWYSYGYIWRILEKLCCSSLVRVNRTGKEMVLMSCCVSSMLGLEMAARLIFLIFERHLRTVGVEEF